MRVLLALLAVAVVASGCLSTPHKPAVGPLPLGAGGDCLGSVGGIDLQGASIADLEAALAAGRITSVQLVEAYLARIAAFDDNHTGHKLNSVRHLDPHARAQAAKLDAERAAGHLRGPLHGIPVLLKDNVGTTDEPTTAGSIALAGNVPKSNATLTDRLTAAGAIILGKTNLSEFANWVALGMPNGYSSLGGQVVNAYTFGDPSGSSSGSGVAGSMAFAAAAIGTETSGSILGPSAATSLVGVKPTTGLVSRAGVIPLAANFDTPGPMARSVRDAAAVLGAIAGTDPRDALTAPASGHLPPGGDYTAGLRADALKGVKLGYDPNDQGATFNAEMDALKAAGATLVPIDRNGADQVSVTELAFIFNEFKAGINGYLATEAGPGLPVSDLTGIVAYNQQHQDRIPYGQDLLVASDAQPGDPVTAQYAATATIVSARATADRLFSGVDAIVGPGLSYVSLGAAAGYPTVIVPAGYTRGEPHGLSFFGPAWSEPKLLAYAYAYENATMLRQPPTAVNAKLMDDVAAACATRPR